MEINWGGRVGTCVYCVYLGDLRKEEIIIAELRKGLRGRILFSSIFQGLFDYSEEPLINVTSKTLKYF